jgi:hypothetical protein
MPTDDQRLESERVNKLAFQLCEEWQKSQRRDHGYALDEITAFMAGVIAAERAARRTP